MAPGACQGPGRRADAECGSLAAALRRGLSTGRHSTGQDSVGALRRRRWAGPGGPLRVGRPRRGRWGGHDPGRIRQRTHLTRASDAWRITWWIPAERRVRGSQPPGRRRGNEATVIRAQRRCRGFRISGDQEIVLGPAPAPASAPRVRRVPFARWPRADLLQRTIRPTPPGRWRRSARRSVRQRGSSSWGQGGPLRAPRTWPMPSSLGLPVPRAHRLAGPATLLAAAGAGVVGGARRRGRAGAGPRVGKRRGGCLPSPTRPSPRARASRLTCGSAERGGPALAPWPP